MAQWEPDASFQDPFRLQQQMRNNAEQAYHSILGSAQHETETPMANATRRIVQVFIADPNENVPLDQSVLYKVDQKLTDATDAELYFEIPIKELLDKHNANRVKILDKDATRKAGKDVFLDVVKIRDLKMVVVNVAQF